MVPPVGVLVLAVTAEVSREAATWFGMRGPVCPLGFLLGECACPGCGLTRSTAMVVQGRWHEAAVLNIGGFAVALLCVAAVVLHADVLRRGRVSDRHLSLRRLGYWCFVGGIALAWVVRAMGLFEPT